MAFQTQTMGPRWVTSATHSSAVHSGAVLIGRRALKEKNDNRWQTSVPPGKQFARTEAVNNGILYGVHASRLGTAQAFLRAQWVGCTSVTSLTPVMPTAGGPKLI